MTPETKSNAKLLAFVIVVAALASVATVLVQVLILGKPNGGVSGGVAGAIGAGVAFTVWKKKSASS